MEAWGKELSKNNIEIEVSQLLNIIQNGKSIMFCSDGGEKLDIGLYGSAIGSRTSKLLNGVG